MAAEGHGGIDALSQFKLEPVFGQLGASLHISQANLMMAVAGVLTLLLIWVGMSPRAIGNVIAASTQLVNEPYEWPTSMTLAYGELPSPLARRSCTISCTVNALTSRLSSALSG